jgi:hypothetical protein
MASSPDKQPSIIPVTNEEVEAFFRDMELGEHHHVNVLSRSVELEEPRPITPAVADEIAVQSQYPLYAAAQANATAAVGQFA